MADIDYSNAIILLYHGVTSQKCQGIRNFSGKHIAQDEFDRQIRYISKDCNPVSLRELVRLLRQDQPLPEKTVAITFDDSFKNVFLNGYPILRKYNVPATLFISTGFVDQKKIVWADILELIVDSLDADDNFSTCLANSGYRGFINLNNREDKVKTLTQIKAYLKSSQEDLKQRLISSLLDQFAQIIEQEESENYFTFSWNDIQDMDKDDLIEIGAHTVNHTILSKVSKEEAEQEIVLSKRNLVSHLGHEIDLFSYPEGGLDHYNQEIIDLLKGNGFIASPSAVDGDNPLGADPFHLKRIMPGFMGTEFPFDYGKH